jgi:phage terminase large subunit-like protein
MEVAASLTTAERRALNDWVFDWKVTARSTQLPPPGDWFVWLYRGGRGAGKTRTGAEYVRARIDAGEWRTVNIAGPTWTDTWRTMVNGNPSTPGLLSMWPPHRRPRLRLSQDDPHLKCWNGAKIQLLAAYQAERFRGVQADGAWADEVDSWAPAKMTPAEGWSNFELGIRLGPDPRIVATSTPKRARLVKTLRLRDDCVMTTDSTYANRMHLAPQFLKMIGHYKGTHLERREIYGEELEDVEGALLSLDEDIGAHRVEVAPPLRRVVVGVDPSGSTGGDRQGIIAVGLGASVDREGNSHGYVLADRSCRLKPFGWGTRAVTTALEFEADCIVVERNYGGDMVRAVVEECAAKIGAHVRVIDVNATMGKHLRFEPVALLYEQARMHHVGTFDPPSTLEEELCAFTANEYEGDGSPDSADAEVFAVTELMLDHCGVSPDELYGPNRTSRPRDNGEGETDDESYDEAW